MGATEAVTSTARHSDRAASDVRRERSGGGPVKCLWLSGSSTGAPGTLAEAMWPTPHLLRGSPSGMTDSAARTSRPPNQVGSPNWMACPCGLGRRAGRTAHTGPRWCVSRRSTALSPCNPSGAGGAPSTRRAWQPRAETGSPRPAGRYAATRRPTLRDPRVRRCHHAPGAKPMSVTHACWRGRRRTGAPRRRSPSPPLSGSCPRMAGSWRSRGPRTEGSFCCSKPPRVGCCRATSVPPAAPRLVP